MLSEAGLIAVIVCGVIMLLAIILYLIRRSRKSRRGKEGPPSLVIEPASDATVVNVLPASPVHAHAVSVPQTEGLPAVNAHPEGASAGLTTITETTVTV